MLREHIPNAVAAVVADAMSRAHKSHSALNTLFMRCGAPGEPPTGNMVEKCRDWLLRCNDDESVDALEVLGSVLEEFMEVDSPSDELRALNERARKRVREMLAKYGLAYVIGGKIEHAAPVATVAADNTQTPPTRPPTGELRQEPTDLAPLQKRPRVFIGHGGQSRDWKDLRDFLEKRLHLECDEFNSEPAAGRSTKERLLELLTRCNFAFLVMTPEDETKGGAPRARQNVIHEIGLFQGRHGWERAVILLEHGCVEFSNIAGIGQIRYEKGNIDARSEEIRRVLEREGIISRP